MGNELEQIGNNKTVATSKTIDLSGRTVIDLTGLTEAQIAELRFTHASGQVELQRKANELNVDVGALSAALDSFNNQTAKATQAGTHATISASQSNSFGRVEVMMGNTDRAAAGKLSSSAVGYQDRLPWIIGIAAVCIVALVVLLK